MNAPARIIDRPERRGLSVADFELLNDAGAFADCGKTELIDGDIYVMNAQYARHARAKARVFAALLDALRAIGSELEALSEVSVRVADDSMPEPDVVVTSYTGDGAIPADFVHLVVEIADTTLDTDLGRKVGLYATAGIPEYWVIDLVASRAVLYDQPDAGGYARERIVPLGGRLTATAVAQLAIETTALLR